MMLTFCIGLLLKNETFASFFTFRTKTVLSIYAVEQLKQPVYERDWDLEVGVTRTV